MTKSTLYIPQSTYSKIHNPHFTINSSYSIFWFPHCAHHWHQSIPSLYLHLFNEQSSSSLVSCIVVYSLHLRAAIPVFSYIEGMVDFQNWWQTENAHADGRNDRQTDYEKDEDVSVYLFLIPLCIFVKVKCQLTHDIWIWYLLKL